MHGQAPANGSLGFLYVRSARPESHAPAGDALVLHSTVIIALYACYRWFMNATIATSTDPHPAIARIVTIM